jgi:hypothetical protein
VHTYRELFRAPEFTPFFLASSVQVAAQTMSSLALGTLLYSATGSPLLSALAIFGPSLTQVIGASTMLSASDRLPPRAVMTGLSLVFAAGTAALAVPGAPVWVAFAIVACLGAGASLAGAVRYGCSTRSPPGPATCSAARCSTCPSEPCRSAVSRPGACS